MLETIAQTRLPVELAHTGVAGKRIHFIGIGGSGMRGLAEVVARQGAVVSGSDRELPNGLDGLRELGVSLSDDQAAGVLPTRLDLVVASAAVADDNAELVSARRAGLKVVKYAAMLGLLMKMQQGLAIAGTHGKSTTTGLTGYILTVAGQDPTLICGAQIPQLGGGARAGQSRWLVAESCEYDRSFHALHPAAAAVLNIEPDHLDCYRDLDEIVESFRTFAARVPDTGLLVVNGEDENALRAVRGLGVRTETFGTSDRCDWQASRLSCEQGLYQFELAYRRRRLGRFGLGIAGRHNVFNAMAAMALANFVGVGFEQMREAVADFAGAERRMTVRGRPSDVTVVDDYAHHPTEIRVTIRAARERFTPAKLWCIFQPHQHSRTRQLFEGFAEAFSEADRVLVPDIYAARDSVADREAVSADRLVAAIRERGVTAEYADKFSAIVDRIVAEAAPGDCVLTMGAGNVWQVADELVRRLQPRR